MKRHFGIPPAPVAGPGAVVTLGMFDGVHRGHQAVLARTAEVARQRAAEGVVVTFDTHPRAVVDPGGAPPTITSLEHRLALFEEQGLDVALVLPFDRELAALSAEAFAGRFLRDAAGAGHVVLGEYAHFGRGREGNVGWLRAHGEAIGLTAEAVAPLMLDGERISSTAVRTAVFHGDLSRAARMLGRPVTVLGEIRSGLGIGRTLGFPTLNLDLHHELHPPEGVYIARTRVGQSVWPSVANIGRRPTIAGTDQSDILVESHVLDVSIGDLGGQRATVQFLRHLREEKRFEDRDALKEAIARDVEAARAWFNGLRGEGGSCPSPD